MDNISQLDQVIAELQALRSNLLPKTYYSKARIDTAPAPFPGLPAPTASFTDPSFGSRLMRVTTPSTDAGASFRVPSNATLAAWSADSKKFYLTSNAGAKVFDFDAANFTATPTTQSPYSQVEPTFSRIDSHTMFTVGGPQVHTIRKFNTLDNTTTDVLDLDTLGLPDLTEPRTYIGGIVSANNKIVAFFGGQGQDNHYLVIIIDLLTGNHTLFNSLTRLNCRLHSLAIDLTGEYILLGPANAKPYQVILWDTITDMTVPVVNSPYGHGALGYGDWVNMDTTSGAWDAAQWSYRKLSNLDSPVNLIPTVLLPKVIYMSDHTTWNHAQPDKKVPVISATYTFGPGLLDPPRAWSNEVIGVATDGSGRVDRFCHHRSIVTDDVSPSNPYFWYQPIPNVSPDGHYALFTSNWGKTLGTEPADPRYFRTDVFLVELR